MYSNTQYIKRLVILFLYPFLIGYSTIIFSDSCSVNVDNLNFGNYRPFSHNNLDNNTNIYLNCSNHLNNDSLIANKFITIYLSTGNSGRYRSRTLLSNLNQLNYNLYTNNQKTIIWGDGTGGSLPVIKRVKTNKQTVVKIYGRIPGNQSIPPGIYTDNIIVTITY